MSEPFYTAFLKWERKPDYPDYLFVVEWGGLDYFKLTSIPHKVNRAHIEGSAVVQCFETGQVVVKTDQQPTRYSSLVEAVCTVPVSENTVIAWYRFRKENDNG